ncbi:lipin-like protein [Achlya hypogyna]|uniref:Lipin-like protein n=1 Tax=Achlya hypogyna TaxID=1202772 RepID=A0A1V9YDG7_ACHHY|nr:lipin-like protein [Achlya hypogyna]
MASNGDDDAYDLFGPAPVAKADDAPPPATKESYASLFPSAAPKETSEDAFEDNPLFPQQTQVPPTERQEGRRLQAPTYRTAEEFKKSGNAIDIILVRNEGGTAVASTPWHAAFSYSRFSSSTTGDHIDVFVNGHQLPIPMVLNDKGRCTFPSGQDTPPDDVLCFLNELIPLDSKALFASVRFEHRKRYSTSVRFVESRLYVWAPDDAVVVADLDGTITISDIEGHIRTLRLGQYDFIHAGACGFFWKLHAIGLRILYLTARPIHWADASREHLDQAAQAPYRLPPGPLITNSSGLTGALLTEVVNKNPNVFKQNVLNAIQLASIHGGRRSPHPVFVAGFGNRPTDVMAYEAVGVDAACIFLIDPTSSLKAVRGAKVFESYSDPDALLWLLPKLKPIVPFSLRDTIDSYIAHEIVEAEDRNAARALAKAKALEAQQRAKALEVQQRALAQSRSLSRTVSSSASARQDDDPTTATSRSTNPVAQHPNRTEL